jgi:hypothetical protein
MNDQIRTSGYRRRFDSGAPVPRRKGATERATNADSGGNKLVNNQGQSSMDAYLHRALLVLTFVAMLTAACTIDDSPQRRSDDVITIPNLTGLSRGRAIGLVDNLDLTIRVEKIGVPEIEAATPSPGIVAACSFARGVVVNQDPLPDTRVSPGATLTLFVPVERALRSGERKFRLLTHCGLSYPLEFDDRFWLPVDREFRRTINAPEGFYSDGYYDVGTIRRIDQETLIYTSSTGKEVRYEPTNKRPGGCE